MERPAGPEASSAAGGQPITTTRMIVFAMPALISSILLGPVAGILPTLYAERFGIDLALIGGLLLAARVFDAVIDPAIGYLSDRTRSRFGPRKPWIAAGFAVTLAATMFLFRPLDGAGTAYFLGFLLLLYFGWSLFEIPYVAWALDLSRDSKVRTTINAYRAAALWIGGILFTLAPALVPAAQGRMGFEALGVVALVLLVAAPLAIIAALAWIPQGEVSVTERQPRLGELWGSVKHNRAFQVFMIVYFFIGLASGASNTVSFLYISSYMGLGDRFTELFLPATLLGPLMIPVWTMMLRRFDKYRVTAVGFTIYAAIMPVPWLIAPGPDAFVPMAAFFCALTVFSPLLMIAMPTILGDIIDDDELRTGANRAGQYSAFQSLLAKLAAAASGPLALLLVGLLGFQPGAATNSPAAIEGLRFVHNLLPLLLVLPGVVLLWRFPMTDARHREIAAALRAKLGARTEA
jgi:glycoside/pentoside/hexuronide:cation symporter, GPH family